MKKEEKRGLHISRFMRSFARLDSPEDIKVVSLPNPVDNRTMNERGRTEENSNSKRRVTSDRLVFKNDGEETPSIELKREANEEEGVVSTQNSERIRQTPRNTKGDVNAFIQCLINGERRDTFDVLHELDIKGDDLEIFLSMAICELDRVRSVRVGNGASHADEYLLNMCKELTAPELEEVIVLLTAGVDHSYRSAQAGVKVAVLRVLDFIYSIKH
ncbi:hypothetical protein CL631_01205 [bacterium]|nr:hypothetical protein [bacterium]|tara:strand:- start:29209 stop:29856 length:648 start_codon:yes stop_codon:yes gene_type:complete